MILKRLNLAARMAFLAGMALYLCTAPVSARAQGLELPIIAAPTPPSTGPGSDAEDNYPGVNGKIMESGAKGWWMFAPAGATTGKLPVIVFCHGWSATNPGLYRAWIEHIVKRGAIVIYPLYQTDVSTPPATFVGNARAALLSAFRFLNTGRAGFTGDPDRVALVGHSAGGNIAASLAGKPAGLPAFKAVMCVSPGRSQGPPSISVPLSNLGAIPASTLMLVLVGDEDRVVGTVDGRRIYDETPQIPASNKNLLEMQSDYHGYPAIVANHFAATGIFGTPATAGENLRNLGKSSPPPASSGSVLVRQRQSPTLHLAVVDALDYYADWKLLDALTDAAFYNKNRAVALGGGKDQLYMGAWGDGTPVKPLLLLK